MMEINMTPWQLQTPVSAIVFDCDGTLSAIEGIDELAAVNGVGAAVKELTALAMGKTGITEALYEQRMSLVRPTLAQVKAIAAEYYQYRTADVQEVIQLFQRLGKSVYIVSAGVHPAVAGFGELLGIAPDHIYAVAVSFDQQGNFLDFNHASPLVRNSGKRVIVEQLKQQHPEIAFVGDGLNDLSVYDTVTRFVGYGGAYYYEKVAERCAFYLKSTSITPILPLVLTAAEGARLSESESMLYQQGLDAIGNGQVIIRSDA
jgi:phosphoserine phosphatase